MDSSITQAGTPEADTAPPLAPDASHVRGPHRGLALSPRQRERLLAVGEVLLCSSVPTQIAISVLLTVAGWASTTEDGQFSLSFVVALSLADTVALIALMAWITRAHGEPVSALWIGSRPIVRETFYGLVRIPLIFLIVVVLLNAIRLVAPSLHNVPNNPLEQLAASSPANAAIFALVAIFAGGVREELQRAFLLRRFERHLGGADVGLVVLSVAFGLGHYQQGWDAAIATGVLGAYWASMYLRRRSSIAPIVSHAGFNSLEILRVAVAGS